MKLSIERGALLGSLAHVQNVVERRTTIPILANVKLQARGGGLTAGKSSIENGRGEFSAVKDIEEIFGNYADAEAHAGAVKSSGARAMTKGEVSLALSGTGRGWDLGIAFGRFTIKRE